MLVARGIAESHELTYGFGKHSGIELAADDPITPAIFFQQRGRKAIETETAAALPSNRLSNPAGVLAINDFPQSRHDMRLRMIAKLHHDPAAAHLVSNG